MPFVYSDADGKERCDWCDDLIEECWCYDEEEEEEEEENQ